MLTGSACLLGGATGAAVPGLNLFTEDNGAVFNRSSPRPRKDAFQPFAGTCHNCASEHPPWRHI
jgi:hypothetical protein